MKANQIGDSSAPCAGLDRNAALDIFAAGFFFCFVLLLSFLKYTKEVSLIDRIEPLVGYDRGFLFTVIEQLLAGRKIYSEVFTPYGFLPNYAYLSVAKIFGNTPEVYHFYTAILASVCAVLSYFTLRRSLGVRAAFLVVFLVFVRCFLRQVDNMIYCNWEVLYFLALMLLWKPLGERNLTRSLILGLLLALMQFCRFGGHFMAFASLAALDLFGGIGAVPKKEVIVLFLRSMTAVVGGYLLLFLPYAFEVRRVLPAPIAHDVLWPSYMLENYDLNFHGQGMPLWNSLNFSLGTNLPIAAGVLVFLLVLIGIGKSRNAVSPDVLFLPPLFYLFSSVFYFHHMFHFWQYELFAVYGAALVPSFRATSFRSLLYLAWLPAAILLLKISGTLIFEARVNDGVPIATPSGFFIYGTPQEAEGYAKLWRTLDEVRGREGPGTAERPRVVFFAPGPGAYFFARVPVPSRHSWFFAGWVRPYEEEQVLCELSRAQAIVSSLSGSETGSSGVTPELAGKLARSFPLREDVSRRLAGQVESVTYVPNIGAVSQLKTSPMPGCE